MVARATIDAIRDRTDIVELVSRDVTLKRKGNSWLGLCPFHQEKTPSFNVIQHRGIYHCFGCGEGGDVFRWAMRMRGLSFMESVRELGQAAGIEVEERELTDDERRRQRVVASLYDVCEHAASWFHAVLMTRPEGKAAREYLEARGITTETIERYRLGFAPDSWDALLNQLHREGISAEQAIAAGLARARDRGKGAYALFRGRVIVPVQDARGRVVAFGGRVLEGDGPKYVNSPETEIYKKSNVLYALSHARADIQRKERVLMVEGYFDVLSLHQAGFREAVATCGTALTAEHLTALRRLTGTVIALFDTDAAGIRAAVKSMGMFLEVDIEPKRLDLGDAKDPDEFIQKRGAEDFEVALSRAEPLFNLVLREAETRHGVTPGGRQRTVAELAPLIRQFPAAARGAVLDRLSSRLAVPLGAIQEQLGAAPAEPRPDMPTRTSRWTGAKDYNHLLWLLIHHPAQASPVFAEVDPDPDSVSDRPAAQRVIALLSQGYDLRTILDELDDPDLASLLRQTAVREAPYDATTAAAAARQILAGMAVRQLDGELARLQREIEACQSGDFGTNYLDLFRKRQDLQRKKRSLLDSLSQRMGRAG